MFTARLGKGLANGAAAADRRLLEKDHGDAQKAGALVLLRVEPEGNNGETQIQWEIPRWFSASLENLRKILHG